MNGPASALFLAIALAGCLSGPYPAPPQGSQPEEGLTAGKRAPDFAIRDVDGRELRLSSNDDVLLLDLMGVNCPPCREEMPHLQMAASHFGGGTGRDNYTQLSVDIGTVFPTLGAESDEDVRAFRDEFQASWRFARDTAESGVGRSFKPLGLPTLLIIDAEGTIRFRKDGAIISAETLIAEIEKART